MLGHMSQTFKSYKEVLDTYVNKAMTGSTASEIENTSLKTLLSYTEDVKHYANLQCFLRKMDSRFEYEGDWFSVRAAQRIISKL